MNFPELNLLTGAGLAAAAAAVGAFWSQAKNFSRYLMGFFLFQKEYVSQSLSSAVAMHLRASYRKMPSGLSRFTATYENLVGCATTRIVPFELPSETSVWYGKTGLYLVNSKGENLHIVSPRFFSSPRQLVIDALTAQAELADQASKGFGNFYVQRLMGTAGETFAGGRGNRGHEGDSGVSPSTEAPIHHGNTPMLGIHHAVDESFMYPREAYLQSQRAEDPMHGLSYPQEVHDLMGKLEHWLQRREWYTAHGIPWRTGVLLHGPGGTGKSSLAVSIAKKLRVPLNQFYLNTFTDQEFVRSWESMTIPCVAALEDFDTVFHGRESVTNHKSLSFETVLNQISGISASKGVLLVMTTNHLEHIDPAMGRLDSRGRPTRPGRIDHILMMGTTSEQQRREIATTVLGGWADDLIQEAMDRGTETTAGQFQFICTELALNRLAES